MTFRQPERKFTSEWRTSLNYDMIPGFKPFTTFNLSRMQLSVLFFLCFTTGSVRVYQNKTIKVTTLDVRFYVCV